MLAQSLPKCFYTTTARLCFSPSSSSPPEQTHQPALLLATNRVCQNSLYCWRDWQKRRSFSRGPDLLPHSPINPQAFHAWAPLSREGTQFSFTTSFLSAPTIRPSPVPSPSNGQARFMALDRTPVLLVAKHIYLCSLCSEEG